MPIVYGGGALGEVAAWRWKGQFNENAKVAAFANRMPELTHNEICGWGQHGDVTRQVFTLVLLRHDHEHPQVQRRFELVAPRSATRWSTTSSRSRRRVTGPLAQLFDLILSATVTLQMAAERGVDPGPVPVLDDAQGTRLTADAGRRRARRSPTLGARHRHG